VNAELVPIVVWFVFAETFNATNSTVIQATLVTRDLTLRVFAITRFRGKKNHEKIVQ
jgi:hypothetical protein